MKIEVVESTELQWPDGWPRTHVSGWIKRSAWKGTRDEYKKRLIKELERMGAVSVRVTRAANDRDPGVAVWFSMAKDTREWQDVLGIDNPLPTVEEINSAFVGLAKKNHPDHGGDVAVYLKLVEARDAAKAWVLGTHTHQHEFVMALDLFNETRLNLAGLSLAVANLRSLKRLGMPSILERTLNKAFKAALPMNAGEGVKP